MDHNIVNIIKHLKEQAQKAMRKNSGDLEPKMYFLILYPGQTTPVYFPIPCSIFFSSSRLKDMMPAYTEVCWLKKKATSPAGIELKAVCVVTDAWMTSRPFKENLTEAEQLTYENELDKTVIPSEDPDRVEVLMISLCFPTHSQGWMIPYIRSGKHIVFKGSAEEALETKGRFSHLYPKNP